VAELFRNLPVEVYTEDGSMGKQGLVSEPLPDILNQMGQSADSGSAEVFACGPDAMLAAVSRLCQECGAAAQVSVAAHMACGVGACQGCVINTVDGYRRACSEGPVFPAADIVW
jgi:dihydroorotate dehydrogenase electron transfer subunit